MPLAAAAVPAQVPAKENASGPASAKESTSEPEVVDPALQRLTDGITKVTEVVSVLTHIRPSASVQYARAARPSLLCAVRTEGSGQLAPMRGTTARTLYACQPRACRTYRVPWHHRSRP